MYQTIDNVIMHAEDRRLLSSEVMVSHDNQHYSYSCGYIPPTHSILKSAPTHTSPAFTVGVGNVIYEENLQSQLGMQMTHNNSVSSNYCESVNNPNRQLDSCMNNNNCNNTTNYNCGNSNAVKSVSTYDGSIPQISTTLIGQPEFINYSQIKTIEENKLETTAVSKKLQSSTTDYSAPFLATESLDFYCQRNFKDEKRDPSSGIVCEYEMNSLINSGFYDNSTNNYGMLGYFDTMPASTQNANHQTYLHHECFNTTTTPDSHYCIDHTTQSLSSEAAETGSSYYSLHGQPNG